MPTGLVRAYDALVDDDIYSSREDALLHAIVESWWHNRGSFHSIRLDLVRGKDMPKEENTEPPANGPEASEN